MLTSCRGLTSKVHQCEGTSTDDCLRLPLECIQFIRRFVKRHTHRWLHDCPFITVESLILQWQQLYQYLPVSTLLQSYTLQLKQTFSVPVRQRQVFSGVNQSLKLSEIWQMCKKNRASRLIWRGRRCVICLRPVSSLWQLSACCLATLIFSHAFTTRRDVRRRCFCSSNSLPLG